MHVTLNYFAQLRQAAGVDKESLPLADNASLGQALLAAVERHPEQFRALLLDDTGRLRPSLIILLNGVPAAGGPDAALKDADAVSIFLPIAGG